MNIKEIKSVATQLTADLKAIGVEIKHAQALEFIARRGGVKEWRALLAKLSEISAPVPQKKLRVLITVSGGVADYVCDEGVSVEKFDWDNFSDLDEGDEKDEMAVPELFRDLAEPLGIPVVGDASEEGYRLDIASTESGDRIGKLTKAGYSFHASDRTHLYWELDEEISDYFDTEQKSIDDAWANFMQHNQVAGEYEIYTGSHKFYKTGDIDAPEAIKDRNGEVVLQQCRICGKAESDLTEVNGSSCHLPPETHCICCRKFFDITNILESDVGGVCTECLASDFHSLASDWRREASNGDTRLGFEEWMIHRLEDEAHDHKMERQILG